MKTLENNIKQTREPFNFIKFIKKDLILYLYQVIKYGKIFIEKFKNENGVPPDEAATSSGKDGRSSYHTIQTMSAIHTLLLYFIIPIFTTTMFCVFMILSVNLKIYLRGVKCG